MVACSVPARTGSAAAAAWAASRILVQTGSIERGSAAFLTTTLSMALSSAPADIPTPGGPIDTPPAGTLRRLRYERNSAGGPGLQLGDQRLDHAAMTLDVGIEVGTSSHDHADALDFHVGDAQAPAGIADFPLQLDRLAADLAQLAIDDEQAVGPGRHLADSERLAGILSETLAISAGLGAFGRLEEAGALGFSRLVPVHTQRRLPHVGQVETGLQHLLDGGLTGGPRRRLLDDVDGLRRRALDQLARIGSQHRQGDDSGGDAGGEAQDETTTG